MQKYECFRRLKKRIQGGAGIIGGKIERTKGGESLEKGLRKTTRKRKREDTGLSSSHGGGSDPGHQA